VGLFHDRDELYNILHNIILLTELLAQSPRWFFFLSYLDSVIITPDKEINIIIKLRSMSDDKYKIGNNMRLQFFIISWQLNCAHNFTPLYSREDREE